VEIEAVGFPLPKRRDIELRLRDLFQGLVDAIFAIALADAARVLTASGTEPVTVDIIQDDIDAGAPTNPDSTVNLVAFAAWLVKEMGRGE